MTCTGSRKQPALINLDHRRRGICPSCGRSYRRDHLGRISNHQSDGGGQ